MTTRLGQRIAKARKAQGLTLRELEKASGISNPLISQIERGLVREPGFRTVGKLAKALGLKLENLL